jgi:hypothetical protein
VILTAAGYGFDSSGIRSSLMAGVRRALVLVATAAALSGCGGSGDDGDEGLTKAEWIAKADAICKESFAAAKDIPRPRSPAQFDEYLAKVLAISRRFDPKFAALEAPEGDEKTVQNLVRLNEEGTLLVANLLDAVRAQDAAKVARIVQQGTANAREFAAAAKAYGSKECAKAGQAANDR